MAKTGGRVVLNRNALAKLDAVFVGAMGGVGKHLIDETKPPDAEPFGEGLVTTGDWGVWANSRKVAGTAQKPRAARLERGSITLLAGWGFPGRFQEMGTVHHAAQPFFSPTIDRLVPGIGRFFQRAFRSARRLV